MKRDFAGASADLVRSFMVGQGAQSDSAKPESCRTSRSYAPACIILVACQTLSADLHTDCALRWKQICTEQRAVALWGSCGGDDDSM